ncbi:MAG: oligosaccharide flippase family protein [Proteobacteria bacterium]|nr:oligosaccharide flippase family protein [Pseudomonadota bacterium]
MDQPTPPADAAERPSAAARLLGAGAGVFALRILGLGLGFGLHLGLARWLGTEEYGVYALVWSWTLLGASLSRLGLPDLAVRELGANPGAPQTAELLSTARTAVPVVATALAAVLWGAADFLVELPSGDPFLCALVLMPLAAWVGVQEAVLRGLRRPLLAGLPDPILRPAVTASGLAIALLLAWPRNASTALWISAAAVLVAVAATTAMLARARPAAAPSPRQTSHREWLLAAAPLLLLGISAVVQRRTDVLMLGSLAGPREAGIYTAAARYAELLLLPLHAANVVVAPRFAELHRHARHDELQRLARGTARGVAVLTLPAAAALWWLREPLLGWFGAEFTAGGAALGWLALAQVANVLAGSVTILLAMTGHSRAAAETGILMAVLNVAANAVLIPRYGITGAALATAASIAVGNGLLAWRVWRLLGINPTGLGGWRRSG